MIKINRFSPIQYGKLIQSCCIVFVALALPFFLIPLPIPFLEVIFHQRIYLMLIVALMIAVSIPLGWQIYKRFYHCILSYDADSFAFQKGKKDILKGQWRDFTAVSLVRSDYDLSIRLYKDENEYVDLPVHKVKLNPQNFRSKIMELIKTEEE